MCDCNYVYCVMDTSDDEPKPIGNRIFSAWSMADAYRKVLVEKYPAHGPCYYVETLEVE